MKIRIVPANRLTDEHAAAWESLLAAHPELDSPFFAMEYTRVIGQTRDDAFVAVFEDAGRIVGFLPYQAEWWGRALPIGSFMSDYNALIGPGDLPFDAEQFLRAAGLERFTFNHMLASQTAFEKFHEVKSESPYISVAEGYEAFKAQNRAGGSTLIPQSESRFRRLEREVGPVRFEVHTTDAGLVDTLLRWKSGQYKATGKPDLFEKPDGWPTKVVKLALKQTAPRCTGIFSALFAGDRFIAGHLGMRSQTIWHNWFPAYDHEMDRYSPGILLVLEMLKNAERMGISRFDLGRGPATYKDRFRNGAIALGEGHMSVFSMKWAVKRAMHNVRSRIKSLWSRGAAASL